MKEDLQGKALGLLFQAKAWFIYTAFFAALTLMLSVRYFVLLPVGFGLIGCGLFAKKHGW
jgi:hypothetical protein